MNSTFPSNVYNGFPNHPQGSSQFHQGHQSFSPDSEMLSNYPQVFSTYLQPYQSSSASVIVVPNSTGPSNYRRMPSRVAQGSSESSYTANGIKNFFDTPRNEIKLEPEIKKLLLQRPCLPLKPLEPSPKRKGRKRKKPSFRMENMRRRIRQQNFRQRKKVEKLMMEKIQAENFEGEEPTEWDSSIVGDNCDELLEEIKTKKNLVGEN
jgi:hypothetical protein